MSGENVKHGKYPQTIWLILILCILHRGLFRSFIGYDATVGRTDQESACKASEDASSATCPSKKEKIKLSNIEFEDLDLNTLIQIQARISRLILEKSK